MLVILILLAVFYALFRFLLRVDPVPLLGVYSQPTKFYWLKFYLMKFVIELRRRKSSKKNDENLMNSQFGGDGGVRKEEEMEKKHKLEDTWSADAVFFDASNADGWYFTLGTAQRQNDIINLFFVLKVPTVGTFVNEELLTDTNVKSISTSDAIWQTASGFVVKCIEPMKEWRITFSGKLTKSPGLTIFEKSGAEKCSSDIEKIDANFDLTWVQIGKLFDFDKAVSSTAIAHSLAIEPWSRQLFDRLRASHQTHYEQFGRLTGTFNILDKTHTTSMTSMRDHTIASHRRWTDIRRYIMMIYHLEDGTCIHTSVISMPETVFSHLEFGYIMTPNGETKPVDRVMFRLANHGEDKHFPNDFFYTFQVGERIFNVDVHIDEVVSFKMGLDLGCQVNEGLASFVVDDKRGWGFVEVEYRIEPY